MHDEPNIPNIDDLTRKMAFEHQRFNTELMHRINRRLWRHEQELIVISIVSIVIVLALGYDDYRIRKLYEATNKELLQHT